MRIDALLSRLGYGSRSEVQKLIRAGAVETEQGVVRSPSESYEGGLLLYKGRAVDTRLDRTILLNKPAGVLTAASDRNQPTVFSLLPGCFQSLGCMPVGRLDKDTTGALLFTTDGTLAHRLISPNSEVKKVYIARVDVPLSRSDIDLFQSGITLKDFTAKPADLEILDPLTARITVTEGKYHQVRRMLAASGHQTLALRRISFGPVVLNDQLPEGQYRELDQEEIAALYQAAGMTYGTVLHQ